VTILDRDDRAFPLPLGPTLPIVRTLYRRSKRLAWSPVTDIPWGRFDGSRYSAEVREAGRIYYSGRAWGEYGAISESPAMQLRYDLDELAPDLSLFWALRTQEEARHAEVSAHMADLLGGYLPEPPAAPTPAVAPEPPALTEAASAPGADAFAPDEVPASGPYLGTRARALAPELPIEATIAGLVCVAETVVYDVFVALIRELTDPVAKEIFRHIIRDEVRHCEFGWEYLALRRPELSPDVLDACRSTMVSMIRDVELGGYRSPWLRADADPGAVHTERIVFEAGLGGTTAEFEGPVLVASIRGVRDRAAGLGIDLPEFHHHLLGDV
jgi:hypothetical protein